MSLKMNTNSLLILTYEFPSNNDRQGGVGTYTFNIAKAFCRKNMNVTVIAPRIFVCNNYDKEQTFKIIRITNILLFREIMFFVFALRFSFRNKPASIFCTTWFPGGFVAYFINKMIKTPYVIAAHGSEILDKQNSGNYTKELIRKCLRIFKKQVFNHSDHIFSVSNFTKRVLIDQGVFAHKISVVNNGVDIDKFMPLPKDKKLQKDYNLDEKKVLLTVSRLDKHKGHDIVIKALPLVLKEVKNMKYLIVGKGSEEDKLKRLVKMLGLDRQVAFLGFVNDNNLVKTYNLCDVFILLPKEIDGDFEGFGLVYLEANACEKPVIGSKTGGIEDAIEDGKTGLLLDSDKPENVASAILKLLLNKNMADRLGKNGLEQIRKYRTWDHSAEEMLRLMKRVS